MCESCNQTVKDSIALLPFLKEHIKERNSRTGNTEFDSLSSAKYFAK
jgi:hypothetical protein